MTYARVLCDVDTELAVLAKLRLSQTIVSAVPESLTTLALAVRLSVRLSLFALNVLRTVHLTYTDGVHQPLHVSHSLTVADQGLKYRSGDVKHCDPLSKFFGRFQFLC